MTLVEELRSKKSRDNRDLLDRAADRIEELERELQKAIVLPIKVGQTVYVPWEWCGQEGVATVEVEEIKFYDSQMHYMFFIDMESDDESFNQAFGRWKIEASIGETVFLSEEAIKKELAEREVKP